MWSGEGAEDIVEKIATVDHELIEEHEEFAKTSSYLMYLLGLLSMAAFYFNRKGKFFFMNYLVLILSVIVTIMMIRTGFLGGSIMHPEARSSAVQEAPTRHDDD